MRLDNRTLVCLLLLTAACVAGLSTGCASLNELTDEPRVARGDLPAYFDEVPADTVFFAGGSEPIPAELLDEAFEVLGLLGDQSEAGLGWAGSEEVLRAAGRDAGAIDEAFGVASSPRFAAYTVGLVPVMRVDLEDPSRAEEAVEAIADDRGFAGSDSEYEERSYRRYTSADSGREFLVRVVDSQLVIAAPSEEAVGDFIPYFVGAEKPSTSMRDDNTFADLVQRHRFEPHASAFLDARRLIDYASGADRPTDLPASLVDAERPNLEGRLGGRACFADFGRLAETAPRVIGGVRALEKGRGEEAIELAGGVELASSVADRLEEAGSRVPAVDDGLLGATFGFRTGPLLDVLVDRARQMRDESSGCEALEPLDGRLQAFIAASEVLPVALRETSGASAYLRDLILEWRADGAGSGLLAIPRLVALLQSDDPTAVAAVFAGPNSELAGVARRTEALEDDPVFVPAPRLGKNYRGAIDPTYLLNERGLAVTLG
ncbi:MAG: hypothetical protein ACOCV2_13455, partial [Persicimonas sp.]